jgi:diaminohydroxyphosphoribosylaminopyrimidine deaminase / 5-amino-6-(5-phosphoribosylamino)uracil reductase
MQRCLALAQLGAGHVAPNPLVGAVLVYDGKIIGEGYHQHYGEAHAEVNCLKSVAAENFAFIEKAILYVSLEPCSHVGKTPPCVDLILNHNIPHVVIGCQDSFEKVAGTGIQKLQAAGVLVELGILENDCRTINKRFFTFHEKKRPYIILKWAQTNYGYIANETGLPLAISNAYTNKLVHKWRATEPAILVGTKTVLADNPTLTTRNWVGNNPTRIIIDEQLAINKNANIYNAAAPTIIINRIKQAVDGNLIFYKMAAQETMVKAVVNCLYTQQLNAVIIEGGTKTLQQFIDENLWDEARIITNTAMNSREGVAAPKLKNEIKIHTENIFDDRIDFYKQQYNEFL